jgi:hypothetical protein
MSGGAARYAAVAKPGRLATAEQITPTQGR